MAPGPWPGASLKVTSMTDLEMIDLLYSSVITSLFLGLCQVNAGFLST